MPFNVFLPTNIRKVRCRQKGTDTKDACQHLKLHPYITASAKTKIPSVVRIQQKEYLVLCTVPSKYLFFTTYITSTDMPTAQQKKRAQLGPTEILSFLFQNFS